MKYFSLVSTNLAQMHSEIMSKRVIVSHATLTVKESYRNAVCLTRVKGNMETPVVASRDLNIAFTSTLNDSHTRVMLCIESYKVVFYFLKQIFHIHVYIHVQTLQISSRMIGNPDIDSSISLIRVMFIVTPRESIFEFEKMETYSMK